tara:strand:+ start:587 stop:1690 length:1104 start_codon:yes stop_codon:yes gene_type:complete
METTRGKWTAAQEEEAMWKKKLFGMRDLHKTINECVYKVDSELKAKALERFFDVQKALKRTCVLNATHNCQWTILSLIHTYVHHTHRVELQAELSRLGILSSNIHRVDDDGFPFSYRILHLDVKNDPPLKRHQLVKLAEGLLPICDELVTDDLCERISKCILDNVPEVDEVSFGTVPPKGWKIMYPLKLLNYSTPMRYEGTEVVDGDVVQTAPPSSKRFQINVAASYTNQHILDVTVPFMMRVGSKPVVVENWEVVRLVFVNSWQDDFRLFRSIAPTRILHGEETRPYPLYALPAMMQRLYTQVLEDGTLGVFSAFATHIGYSKSGKKMTRRDEDVERLIQTYLSPSPITIPTVNLLTSELLEDLRY